MKILDQHVRTKFDELINRYPAVHTIAKAIADRGGFALVVGGAVRDLLLELPVKDIDIEVHGISLEILEDILRTIGPVSEVGKAFGVLRIHGLDIDWSMPRADSAGRKPRVLIDATMSIEDAFRRRDLTINAMGINILTHELVDPFNGLQDLRKGILRAPDTTLFVEDPLRFFRVMQFIARFEMKPDAQLNELCATMNIKSVSRERIEGEFTKWLLKSKRPSLSLLWLKEIKRLQEIFPEVAATQSIEQNPEWHPEGDVFEHTLQTVDAAAQLQYENEQEKLPLMYAALCHDLGKVVTTETTEEKITSYGHELDSERLAKKLLKKYITNIYLTTQVAKLVRYHMHPLQFVQSNAGPSAYKRLANKLAPEVTMHMLGLLAMADRLGRNPQKGKPLTSTVPDVEKFLERAKSANVMQKPIEPLLHGRDFLDIIQPGPELGKIVKKAYELQIDENITNKEQLKQRVLQLLT